MANRCPRCRGWLYVEPDLGPGRWLKCIQCGWEHWLGPERDSKDGKVGDYEGRAISTVESASGKVESRADKGQPTLTVTRRIPPGVWHPCRFFGADSCG